MIRVLVVDDHAIVRAGICAVLQRTDDIVVVGECADGDQVHRAVTTTCPTVVVMDQQMPVMSGAEATRRLRLTHPTLPVIIVSAAATPGEVVEAATSGANTFLAKDGNVGALVSAIRDLAGGAATSCRGPVG